MKKIRRDKLMRLAKAGLLVKVGSYHYDEMQGQEISKNRVPVRFSTGYQDFIEGQCNLREHHFTSHSGYSSLSDDGQTAHLGVHSNCSFDLQMADGSPFISSNATPAKAKRPENSRMQDFLKANGILATPKYLHDGSLRGCWRLSSSEPWCIELANKLNALGFVDFDGKPLGQFSGNGGHFCVFVRGHSELLVQATPQTEAA